MRVRAVVTAILFLSVGAFAAEPEPYLKSAPMPFYSPLARQARIEGRVSIHFTVDGQGDASGIEAFTGHELLRRAAIENIQNWKFGWPHPCACRIKRNAVFVYKFSGELESRDRPTVMVKWFGRTGVIRVEIESDLIQFQTQDAH